MKFVLNKANWRCGFGYGDQERNNKTGLGLGDTFLLNKEGYMCCLGQVSEQLGVPRDNLLNNVSPNEMNVQYGYGFVFDKELSIFHDNELSTSAMSINDNKETTISEKVAALTILFESYGHELEVIDDVYCAARL